MAKRSVPLSRIYGLLEPGPVLLRPIVPAALVSQERRALALQVGRFGRTASTYNLVSMSQAFGLSREEAEAQIGSMLRVVEFWKDHIAAHGIGQAS